MNQKLCDACKKFLFFKDANIILDTINDILADGGKDNENLDGAIYIYCNYDQLKERSDLEKSFFKAISEYFRLNIDKKLCIMTAILCELDRMMNAKNFYQGFKNIEDIIRYYNNEGDFRRDIEKVYTYGDAYGESISKELSDLMHDYDLSESYIFSKSSSEDDAIHKVNKSYDNRESEKYIRDVFNALMHQFKQEQERFFFDRNIESQNE